MRTIPNFDYPGKVVLCCLRGSHAHGTALDATESQATDDVDYTVLFVPELRYYLGGMACAPHQSIQYQEGHADVAAYELSKALYLLAGINPNMLSMLWTDPEDYIYLSEGAKILIDNRRMFSVKEAWSNFSGYAYGQLQRMQKSTYAGYMGERRKSLARQYGYDIKHAAHVIMLLRQGIEFMQTGELVVRRPDAEELKAIKRGERSLDSIIEESEELFELGKLSHENSPLPSRINRQEVANLCYQLLQLELGIIQKE